MNKKNDIGVLVGRFQVPELHIAHIDLINQVKTTNERVIVFLGLSPSKVTRNNPLDFESRKQMLLEKFPDITVLYINDVQDDSQWSKSLDRQIQSIAGPHDNVILYGGRDAFTVHYNGKFKTMEMEQKVYASGSSIRKNISKRVKSDSAFRSGVIWAAYNQYQKAIPTVDIAPFRMNIDGSYSVMVAKKPEENKFRFMGGFAQGKCSYEEEAMREIMEETGDTCVFSSMKYVCSSHINDWRYKNEMDGITTTLFATEYISGVPSPSDDLEDGVITWVSEDELLDYVNIFQTEHHELVKMFMTYMVTNNIKPQRCADATGENNE